MFMTVVNVRVVRVAGGFVINVGVGHRLMVVFVPLGRVQSDPKTHQRGGQEKAAGVLAPNSAAAARA